MVECGKCGYGFWNHGARISIKINKTQTMEGVYCPGCRGFWMCDGRFIAKETYLNHVGCAR